MGVGERVRWSVLMFGSHNTTAALAAVVFSLKFKRIIQIRAF